MEQGICRNPACPAAPNQTPVDRYPGAGEYCPDCGEPLEPVVQAAPPAPAAPPPFGGASPLQALQQLEGAGPAAKTRRRRPALRPYAIASAAVVLGTMVTGGALHQAAIGHPNGDQVHVCSSSVSRRLAADVLAAYQTATRRRSIAPGRRGTCDVRFAAAWGADAHTAAVVGRDAVVVVVNPQNPVAHLTLPQLRSVLTGGIADWSAFGIDFGSIGVVVPDEGTDEAALVDARILDGASLGHDVRRVRSSQDVVSAVTGPQGRRLIGIAAYSAALAAKMLAVTPGVPPNRFSIADGHYPFVVAIAVEAAGAAPPPAATDLVRYARSEAARTIVERDRLVPATGG